jgi:hypothetical protein
MTDNQKSVKSAPGAPKAGGTGHEADGAKIGAAFLAKANGDPSAAAQLWNSYLAQSNDAADTQRSKYVLNYFNSQKKLAKKQSSKPALSFTGTN